MLRVIMPRVIILRVVVTVYKTNSHNTWMYLYSQEPPLSLQSTACADNILNN
jgi:hypothetical protein